MTGILIALLIGLLGMICLGPSVKAFYNFDDFDAPPLTRGQKIKIVAPAIAYALVLISFLIYTMKS